MAAWTSQRSGDWSVTSDNANSPWYDNGAQSLLAAVPANADTVTIASGHTVVFDVDQSAWANGLSTLTVTGTLNLGTAAGTAYLKTNQNISTGGLITAGSSGTAVPMTRTITVDFASANKGFVFTGTGKLETYCTNPTNQYVKLTATEPALETVLAVDTNVTGDIWAAGDTVYVCNVDSGVDAEERVIDSIAAGTITLTVGLTAEKIAGSYVVLATRNIRFINAGATGDFFVASAVGCHIGAWLDNGRWAMYYGYNNTVSGPITGCTYGLYFSYNNTVSGPITGCTNGLSSSYNNTVSGPITGCDRGLSSSYNNTVSGPITGCDRGLSASYNNTVSGPITGCAYGLSASYNNTVSGPITGCAYGLSYSYSNTVSGPITGCTYGLSSSYDNTMFGADFTDTTTEFSGLGTSRHAVWNFDASYDHNATAGAFKSWSKGGITASETTTVPTGYTQGFKMTCESATYSCFHQDDFTIMPGDTLRIRGSIKFADDHSTYKPRVQIVCPSNDPLADDTDTPLDESIVASGTDTDWQAVEVSYKNTTSLPKPIMIRTLAKRAAGGVYFGYKTDELSGGITLRTRYTFV